MESVRGGSEGRPPLATLLAPPPPRPPFLLFWEPLNTGAGNSWRLHWASGHRESAPPLPRPPTTDFTRGRDVAPPLQPWRPAPVLRFCRAASLSPLGAALFCFSLRRDPRGPPQSLHSLSPDPSFAPFSPFLRLCAQMASCVGSQCRGFERQIKRRLHFPNPLSFLPLT